MSRRNHNSRLNDQRVRKNSTYNVLMYSHDTYGLGHIRRTMAIAGRFVFPEHVDFVRIPGMIKKTNEEYLPLSIKINPRHALDIRRCIITTTAKAFRPHLFIVDKEPLGLKKEVLPTLKWLQRRLPRTKTILGLRDIMDEATIVQEDWAKKGAYQAMNNLYSEIWVYGIQDFYNPIEEYAIPEPIKSKILFTGYIPRKVWGKTARSDFRREHGIKDDDMLVAVTTGGGGDGYAVMDTYLSMLESSSEAFPFKSVLITGPFMPKKRRMQVFRRAKRLGVHFYHFYRQMGKMFAGADLVVSMGGYNTVCEILSQRTLSLVIPRETPRMEQLIRAQAFHSKKLLDFIPWHSCTPSVLGEKIRSLLKHPEPYQQAICRFRLTGVETIRKRLQAFRGEDS